MRQTFKPGILVDYRDYHCIVLYVKSSVEGGFTEILLPRCRPMLHAPTDNVKERLQVDSVDLRVQCEVVIFAEVEIIIQ